MTIILADVPTILTKSSRARRMLATTRPVPATAETTETYNVMQLGERAAETCVVANVDPSYQKLNIAPAATEPNVYYVPCLRYPKRNIFFEDEFCIYANEARNDGD